MKFKNGSILNLTVYISPSFFKNIAFLTKYDILIILSASSAGKEVETVEYITTFVLSVMAGIVDHYLCKWLDRHKSDK